MDWTARLRLRNLQMLLSLAQTQNISRSAAALNTTQPGLSKWLRELEADVGLLLFERHARGLKPTSHGEALIAHAKRIEAHLDVARDDMAAMRDGGSGRVVVGASGASASDTVPLAVLKLTQLLPQASIKLVESTTDRLLDLLGDGDLDLVVGRSSRNLPVIEIRSETLYVEPIHFVARPRHPLFGERTLDWDDLFAYRWLVWPKGTPIRDSFDDALAAAGRTLPARVVEFELGDAQSHLAQQQRHDRSRLIPGGDAFRPYERHAHRTAQAGGVWHRDHVLARGRGRSRGRGGDARLLAGGCGRAVGTGGGTEITRSAMM